MTTTAVQDFLTKVGEDQALQGEMAKVLDTDNDREAVTALAKANGYEFTTEELWAEIQTRQAEIERRQSAGELSDEELEAVAGGEFLLVGSAIAVTLSFVGTGVGGYALTQAKW